jgi:hypothetical protein
MMAEGNALSKILFMIAKKKDRYYEIVIKSTAGRRQICAPRKVSRKYDKLVIDIAAGDGTEHVATRLSSRVLCKKG